MGLRTTVAVLAMVAALSAPHRVTAAEFIEPDSVASDVGKFYVRGDAGWSFLEWDAGDDDDAFTAGLGVGYQWHDYLRTDVRADWSGPYETDAVDLEATTVLGNAYIDIPLTENIKPYVGAGLGWGWVEGDGAVEDDSGLAYSAMVGSAFTLTGNIDLDVGYRFRGISIDDEDVTDHAVTGGIRFKF